MEKAFTTKELSVLFNEWMRRFIQEPETFAHEWETVAQFLKEQSEGKEEPSYGDICAQYLFKLYDEMIEPVKG